MRLKLKEEPREWQKFTSVLLVLALGVSALLWRRGLLNRQMLAAIGLSLVAVAIVCWLWPRPFRRVYRGGMTASFHVGQVMGMVLLTVLFMVLVVPLGLLLRLSGKDLLRLKRPHGRSYWLECSAPQRLDRQF